jgi:hypothetical protein
LNDLNLRWRLRRKEDLGRRGNLDWRRLPRRGELGGLLWSLGRSEDLGRGDDLLPRGGELDGLLWRLHSSEDLRRRGQLPRGE